VAKIVLEKYFLRSQVNATKCHLTCRANIFAVSSLWLLRILSVYQKSKAAHL